MLQPIGLLSDASQRNRLRKLFTAVVLLLATQAPLLAQVEVELKYGGTLHGYVVAANDSTITLRLRAEGDAMRDAVLRRSDITFLSGTDTVSPPPPPAAESTEEEIPWYANPNVTLRYRNEVTGGISWMKGTPGAQLGYQHTSRDLLRDQEHVLESSVHTVPTGYLSVAFAMDMLRIASSWEAEVFYGHLLRPELAVGGGIYFDDMDAAHSPEINRYAVAGRVDYFPSEGLRFRETAGIGIARGLDTSRDTGSLLLLVAQHRIDYAMEGAILEEYLGYPVRLGFQNDIKLHHMDESGTVLQLGGGIESNLAGFMSFFAGLNYTVTAPSHGVTETEIGGHVGYRWLLGHRFTLTFCRNFGKHLGWYVNASATPYVILMQFRF